MTASGREGRQLGQGAGVPADHLIYGALGLAAAVDKLQERLGCAQPAENSISERHLQRSPWPRRRLLSGDHRPRSSAGGSTDGAAFKAGPAC